MNVRKISLILCALLLTLGTILPLWAASPEESFRKGFPNTRMDGIRPTAIPGIYEILSGSRVFYYAPGPEYILYGPIITHDGKNLTEERMREVMENGLKKISLEKALNIGSGTHQVIEITDPDCAFCRKAAAFFAGRKDVTRHIFLFPLAAMHPNAEAKARQIFCAEDRGKAYEEAMTGKLDDMKFTPCKSDAAEELLKAHKEIGSRLGVTGTPLFLIDGQFIFGADIPRMEKILNDKK
jgi:thiol:disulfide interchange protein DsbC